MVTKGIVKYFKCYRGKGIIPSFSKINMTNLVSYDTVVHMWERKNGQSVEEAIQQNEPCEYVLRDEVLGESLAIRHDDTGFLTTTDGKTNAPIYFYKYY